MSLCLFQTLNVISVTLLYTLIMLPHPTTAWSQEVLHNAAQDLVKAFILSVYQQYCCFFKMLKAAKSKKRCVMLQDGVKRGIIFLSSFLFVSAVHPPGAAAERRRRCHTLLFTLVFFLILHAHRSLYGVSGRVGVLPGHPEHPAWQDVGDAGGGLPVPSVHHEEADGTEQTRQRCRSGSVLVTVLEIL